MFPTCGRLPSVRHDRESSSFVHSFVSQPHADAAHLVAHALEVGHQRLLVVAAGVGRQAFHAVCCGAGDGGRPPLEGVLRVERIMRKQGITEDEARKTIDQVDKMRENYVNRYTGTSRYDTRNYDIVLRADGKTEEQIADLIMQYIG